MSFSEAIIYILIKKNLTYTFYKLHKKAPPPKKKKIKINHTTERGVAVTRSTTHLTTIYII